MRCAPGIDSFLMIHDSYATHAADMEALRRILREEFVKMYANDKPLEKLRQALLSEETRNAGKVPEIAVGDFDIAQVLESEYFFS
jgi:DNA-directed RNA polymerase